MLNVIILIVIIGILLLNTNEMFQCPIDASPLDTLGSFKSLGKSECAINDPNNFFSELDEDEINEIVCIGKNMKPSNSIDTVSKAWCRKKK
tara:strand:+ start:2413 stop:2685 length:273 start_codon:yes stop_codon:yes gene_type:complete